MEFATTSCDRPDASIIATARLGLRPARAGDIDAIVEGLGDARVSRMLARVPFPYTRADAALFVSAANEQNASGRYLHLMIDLDGRTIGGIGLHGLPEVEDFGYWLAPGHWGMGYATEAATGLLAHAFDVLGVVRVPSGVFADNPASLRVQEKLGFRRVGASRRFSLARGHDVVHIDTVLTRGAWFGETGR